MADFDLSRSLYPQVAGWGIQKSGVQFSSPHNGSTQSVTYVAERWMANLTLPIKSCTDAGAAEAFFNNLCGGENRVRLHHPNPMAYYPRGTMRGTPTIQTQATRGNSSIIVQAAAGETLKAGDMLGCSGHLFQVRADCTANGSGVITIPVVNRVRSTIAVSAAVTWDRPTAYFIMPSMSNGAVHRTGYIEGMAIDLVEVW